MVQFLPGAWHPGPVTGAPLLDGALAYLECDWRRPTTAATTQCSSAGSGGSSGPGSTATPAVLRRPLPPTAARRRRPSRAGGAGAGPRPGRPGRAARPAARRRPPPRPPPRPGRPPPGWHLPEPVAGGRMARAVPRVSSGTAWITMLMVSGWPMPSRKPAAASRTPSMAALAASSRARPRRPTTPGPIPRCTPRMAGRR
jgi:hypothetical protein